MSSYNNQSDNRTIRHQKWWAWRHIAMGIFYLIIGALVLYMRHFGTIELSPAAAMGLGILVIIYGLFRIWRGYKDLQEAKMAAQDWDSIPEGK